MNSLLRQQYNFIKKNQYTILLCIIAVLFLISLYNVFIKHHEPFVSTITKDCSDCRVQPSGSCIKLPTVNDGKIKDSSFVFCKWQEQCSIKNESYFTNAEYSYDNIQTASGEITSYSCCPESEFYNTYNTTINDMSKGFLQEVYSRCNYISSIINDPKREDKDISTYEINACNKFKLDMSNNTDGLLFKRNETISESIYNSDIINNETITNKQLLGYINTRYPVLKDWVKREKSNNEYKEYLKLINNIKNNKGDINMFKVLIYNNYIKEYESKYNNGFVQNKKYKWRLLNKFGIAINSDEFILNEDEFFKCNGDISSQDICTNLFSIGSDNIFNDTSGVNDNGYFGVNDNNIKTVADYKIGTDPIDKEMEQLPIISNQSNMAPVSVINQYLNHITSFYNKQLNNMLGPQTHARQDKIRFNNNTIDHVNSGYFTYSNNLTDNSYDIIPSITGDTSFNYLGPKPYLDINYSFY